MAKRITINGIGPFYETPLSCGDCKFSINHNMHEAGGKSFCVLFGKQKKLLRQAAEAMREDVRKGFRHRW